MTARSLALAMTVIGLAMAAPAADAAPFRSPAAVACRADGRLVTANAAAGSVSLVDPQRGFVAEIPVGPRPTGIAVSPAGAVAVSVREGGDLVLLDVVGDRLVERARVPLGFEPWDVALSPDGARAYVPLSAAGQLAIVDLASRAVAATVDVGRLPRHVAVSPDGATVAVACSEGAALVLVDAASATVRGRFPFKGFNLGAVAFAPDGTALYFAWTYDGGSNPSPGNIRRGWVTGSRLGRLAFPADGSEPVLEGLTLDVSGKAVGDVLGVAVAPDGGAVFVAAGGTHELLRFTTADLPWTQISGLEVMDPRLAADRERFTRIELGGRPLGLAIDPRGDRVWVANALADEVQAVALAPAGDGPAVVAALPVGPAGAIDDRALLVRRGEAIFHDARRSLDQWYSCHTCHYEGGSSTMTFDTRNDGSIGTYKTVLPLWGVAATGPWTWHGWQTDLAQSLEKSLIESMQGPKPTADDVAALGAYLESLAPPPSPFRTPTGAAAEAVERGRQIFESARGGCTSCHAGPWFTTSENHDVGLGREGDRYPSFSPPSLTGVFRKTRLLHHGKARSLRDVVTKYHGPEAVSGEAPLTEAEADDLVAYLKAL